MEQRIEAHGRSYVIEVDPEGLIGERIIESGGPYEPALLEHIFEQYFNGLAVDVGAHIGNHSLWFAVVCGLRTIAFEPLEYEALRANVERNRLRGQVRVEPLALGDREGTARACGEGRLQLDRGGIPVRRLDAYELAGVAVLKIDVEDMEPFVLRGAEQTIRRERPVIFAEARDDECHEAIAAVLDPWGYAVTKEFLRGTRVERWDPS